MKTCLLLLLSTFALAGCATSATKGDLPVLGILPSLPNEKSVTFRYSIRHDWLRPCEGEIEIQPKASENLEKALQESKIFTRVVAHTTQTTRITLSEENCNEGEIKALEVHFPVETDYFFDIENDPNKTGRHGIGNWFLVHALTLGLFPVVLNNDVTLKLTVYSKTGVKIAEDKITEKSTLWAWSPLFFFNGFHAFRSLTVHSDPLERNVLKHLILNLKNNGKLI